MTIEDDMREVFENVDDFAAQEIAEEIYQIAEETQNQEMENALARIEARRPRQFRTRSSGRSAFTRANLLREPKKKRKVSAYSKRFGIELKKLKKLHPRTKVQNLMKKAHRRTKDAMKRK
jgi:cystathionine beta-lyase/cystathionine gamma-synthase